MINKELLDILACPLCKTEVKYDKKNSWLKCVKCKRKYPVKDDIPIMLVDEAITDEVDPEPLKK